MLQVKAIPGEPTCYYVESHHMQCTGKECTALTRRAPSVIWFNRKQRNFLATVGVWGRVESMLKKLAEGWRADGQCRRCGAALELRWHRVDIGAFNCNGQCGCEYFGLALAKELRRLKPEQQAAGLHRCSHIEAARDFALDLSLKAHERQNGRKK